jgi:C-terminal processing protease CtpA/Prc
VSVLVDRRTISAGEAVAALFKHYRKAPIVGEPTHGKTEYVDLEPLGSGYYLHVTSGTFHVPSAAAAEPLPVQPDVRLLDDPDTLADEALAAAISVLTER